MSIASELDKLIEEVHKSGFDSVPIVELQEVSRRIDHRHRTVVQAAILEGERMTITAEQAEGFNEERLELLDSFVELPKDANGNHIHVGDTVISLADGAPFEVGVLTLTRDGWEVDGDSPTTVRAVADDTFTAVIQDAFRAGRNGKDDYDLLECLVERLRRIADDHQDA